MREEREREGERGGKKRVRKSEGREREKEQERGGDRGSRRQRWGQSNRVGEKERVRFSLTPTLPPRFCARHK